MKQLIISTVCVLLSFEIFSQTAIPNVEITGRLKLISNIGDSSTYIGLDAGLSDDRTDNENLFIGILSGTKNTIGNDNVFIGMQSGYANISGSDNLFVGRFTGPSNTLGNDNTFLGRSAGRDNTIGNANTFVGRSSGLSNVGGNDNVFVGRSAGSANTNGLNNVFVGRSAGLINTFGDDNCFIGRWSGIRHKFGDNNTFVGESAGRTDSLGINNTIIGADADVLYYNLSNSTSIGFQAIVPSSNQIVLGNPFVTQIGGYASWSILSDGRFKKDVSENVPGLNFINRLRPVTYTVDRNQVFHHMARSKSTSTFEAQAHKETGFIAQEVEAICNEIGYDFNGVIKPQSDQDHYKLAYAEFVVPLTKAIQEQQMMIVQLQEEIKNLKRNLSEIKN